MDYTFNDHLHNYAVWTAARAVQRNFTNTKNIKAAIEQTTLRKFVQSNNVTSEKEFDDFHRATAKKLIQYFTGIPIFASYGHAAKIIAVYLKTSIIIRDSGMSLLSRIAHPPIDNILLMNISKDFPSFNVHLIKWTYLNEQDYFALIEKFRSIGCNYFWELERYWTPIQNQ